MKLTALERQAASTAVATVQDCVGTWTRPHMVYVIAITPEGNAAANVLWEGLYEPLGNDALYRIAQEGLADCIRKRETMRVQHEQDGVSGEHNLAGEDVLIG